MIKVACGSSKRDDLEVEDASVAKESVLSLTTLGAWSRLWLRSGFVTSAAESGKCRDFR